VSAAQIHGLQQRVAGRGQRPPTRVSISPGVGDQVGRHEFVQGDLDGGRPDGPAVVGECGGELAGGLRAARPECFEDADGGAPQLAGGSASLASAAW